MKEKERFRLVANREALSCRPVHQRYCGLKICKMLLWKCHIPKYVDLPLFCKPNRTERLSNSKMNLYYTLWSQLSQKAGSFRWFGSQNVNFIPDPWLFEDILYHFHSTAVRLPKRHQRTELLWPWDHAQPMAVRWWRKISPSLRNYACMKENIGIVLVWKLLHELKKVATGLFVLKCQTTNCAIVPVHNRAWNLAIQLWSGD